MPTIYRDDIDEETYRILDLMAQMLANLSHRLTVIEKVSLTEKARDAAEQDRMRFLDMRVALERLLYPGGYDEE
jgi:hypothetical protein